MQSGYRWILTYNLIHNESIASQSAARLDAEIASLAQPFMMWHNLSQGPQCLCYALSHQYTKRSLKLTSLKGDDYYKARSIVDACNNFGEFRVLFASMENVVTFMNGEGGEDEKTSQLELHNIVDLEGFILQPFLVIPEDFLLQAELYDSRDPDQRNGGEYMGNQHADFDEHYKDTVRYFDEAHYIFLLS